MTKDQYEINQKDKKRIDGTNIGKKAIRDFVRGLQLRMDSSVTSVKTKANWENNKFAVAFWFFYKWIAEVKEFDEICDESINIPIVTFWADKGGKVRSIQNCFDEEPKSVEVFIRMARVHLKYLKAFRKISKIWKRNSNRRMK